jgi:uncharacterized protein with PIN domain
MQFITDINLGRLAVRLRMLGFDTIFYRGTADRNFLRIAQQENRVVLTRKRELAKRQFQGILVVVESDRVERQLEELLSKLNLKPESDRYFSLCLRCNVPLQEILREDVVNRVPPYVYENYSRFMTCPRCGAIYWPGTHIEHARNWIRALHIPSRHP